MWFLWLVVGCIHSVLITVRVNWTWLGNKSYFNLQKWKTWFHQRKSESSRRELLVCWHRHFMTATVDTTAPPDWQNICWRSSDSEQLQHNSVHNGNNGRIHPLIECAFVTTARYFYFSGIWKALKQAPPFRLFHIETNTKQYGSLCKVHCCTDIGSK